MPILVTGAIGKVGREAAPPDIITFEPASSITSFPEMDPRHGAIINELLLAVGRP